MQNFRGFIHDWLSATLFRLADGYLVSSQILVVGWVVVVGFKHEAYRQCEAGDKDQQNQAAIFELLFHFKSLDGA